MRAFTDWKTYAVSIAYSCMNLGLGSVSAYLPTIIKGLGYTNAEAQVRLLLSRRVSLHFSSSDYELNSALDPLSFSSTQSLLTPSLSSSCSWLPHSRIDTSSELSPS